jgi:protein-L-isoaspartate(D-aspartate) O-methyltransferase
MSSKKQFIKLLRKNKIRKKVIDSCERIDQKDFFDPIFKKSFYTAESIPIGYGETSDPPMALARMLHLLSSRKDVRVLEIGTGSGYSTALLSQFASEVVTIEYHENLGVAAKERLSKLSIRNVKIFAGDGTALDAAFDPFDAILIFAACHKRPLALMRYLKSDGMIIFPMGPPHQQQITVLDIEDDNDGVYRTHFHEFCTFSPIRGIYGIELLRSYEP